MDINITSIGGLSIWVWAGMYMFGFLLNKLCNHIWGDKETEFDVLLTGFGDSRIPVIKAVSASTGLGLKEAKELVGSAPAVLKKGISSEEAEQLKDEIEAAGGACEIK